jgi:predicted nucleic acid-binding protein
VIIVDTGPLVAAALVKDPDHHACVELFTGLHLAGRELIIPTPVIAVAERPNVPEVATLDHRHFTVVRPHHVKSLTLLP